MKGLAPAAQALLLSLAVVLSVASFSEVAQAGQTEAERQARRSFQSAEANFRAGRFAEALTEYQAGYEKLPLPGFLINIAQCQRRLGDLQRARTTYQRFVMVAPDSPHVAEVKTLIAELDKLIADLEAPQKPAASAEVAAAPAEAPAPPPLPPAPVPAAAPVLVAPPTSASAPVSEPASPPAKRRWWLWSLVGAAVAGSAVATYALTASPSNTTVHEGTLGTLRR